MKDFMNKLTSRKFIACMIGVVVGLATIFGIDGNTITDVAGLIVTLVSSVSYIITEGAIDAKAVGQLTDVLESVEGEVFEVETDEGK